MILLLKISYTCRTENSLRLCLTRDQDPCFTVLGSFSYMHAVVRRKLLSCVQYIFLKLINDDCRWWSISIKRLIYQEMYRLDALIQHLALLVQNILMLQLRKVLPWIDFLSHFARFNSQILLSCCKKMSRCPSHQSGIHHS